MNFILCADESELCLTLATSGTEQMLAQHGRLGRYMLNRSFWKGRQVLLTGHTGFKGSWLSLWLEATRRQRDRIFT